jgi:protein SCO1
MTNDKAKTDEINTERRPQGAAPRVRIISIVTLCLIGIFAGCAGQSAQQSSAVEEPAPTPSTNTAQETAAELHKPTKENPLIFQVRGIVQELRPADKEIVIKHEAIPNYMPAMTMPFEVKNTNEFSGVSPNDQVTFRMIVTDAEGWIENLQKIGVDVTSQTQQPKPKTRLVRDVDPLEVGDKMPNYPFTNSLGEKVELKDFAGQAYALTFIFTRCPFPNFCPRMNINFEKAYENLKNNSSSLTNWHFFSISFDPEFDTPQRLKQYSATYNPDPKKWSWVTGAMIEIDAITEQLGVVFAQENNTINHNLRTAVIDKNGVIRQIFIGNEWTADELAREMIAGAQGKPPGQY